MRGVGEAGRPLGRGAGRRGSHGPAPPPRVLVATRLWRSCRFCARRCCPLPAWKRQGHPSFSGPFRWHVSIAGRGHRCPRCRLTGTGAQVRPSRERAPRVRASRAADASPPRTASSRGLHGRVQSPAATRALSCGQRRNPPPRPRMLPPAQRHPFPVSPGAPPAPLPRSASFTTL